MYLVRPHEMLPLSTSSASEPRPSLLITAVRLSAMSIFQLSRQSENGFSTLAAVTLELRAAKLLTLKQSAQKRYEAELRSWLTYLTCHMVYVASGEVDLDF